MSENADVNDEAVDMTGLESSAEEKKVRLWKRNLTKAQHEEKDWRFRASKVLERYRDERHAWNRYNSNKFNILWANVETLRPALYSRCPRPDVRRRFRDVDPIGKAMSDIFERSLSNNLDGYDFDQVMNQAIVDYLLVGRAVTRIRFDHTVTKESQDRGEVVYAEPVHWQDFLRGPGRYWHEVEWVAFKHRLNRDRLVEKFGRKALKLFEENQKEEVTVVTLWEIWDKQKREVHFFAPQIEVILQTFKDPLKLKGFFPIPQPLYSFQDTGSLVPVPDFCCYKDQADELDRLTTRISKLVSALKARGVFDSRVTEFRDLMLADDAELVPAENISLLLQAGGIEKAVWFLPIEQIARVLQSLYAQREHLKQSIYELTGISDVIRGSSQVGETATAQSIKAQYGSQRLQRRQRDVQRYARDLLRLKAEIMGKHFSFEAFERMSGMQLDLMMRKLMREEGANGYRIDIETDSTILPDLQEDQRNISQLLNSVVSFIQGVTPSVESGTLPLDAAKALLMASVRRHRMGRDVEEALDQIGK